MQRKGGSSGAERREARGEGRQIERFPNSGVATGVESLALVECRVSSDDRRRLARQLEMAALVRGARLLTAAARQGVRTQRLLSSVVTSASARTSSWRLSAPQPIVSPHVLSTLSLQVRTRPTPYHLSSLKVAGRPLQRLIRGRARIAGCITAPDTSLGDTRCGRASTSTRASFSPRAPCGGSADYHMSSQRRWKGSSLARTHTE
ncbi:NADH dehydrogenase (ubiquinone) acyl carrier protein isoform X3 [Arctopsyche grandis]|uniref:NADH dehydrogenase (ubiquinone) acyl carrier protein isoform X3 n=1 Tax=Arctopsyche grandis TaxID=121162 RepID=UPI00406D6A0B